VSVPPDLSEEFAAIARAESERLRVRVLELRARSERWSDRARQLAEEAERLSARLRNLDEILGRAPQLRLDLQTQTLQGQKLREEAVRILVEERGTRQPIHYREWYALLGEAGLAAAGKDPVATFLTQITRSPLVERVEGQSGTYLVDPAGAYERAREELAAATRELAAAEDALAADGAENPERLVRVRAAQAAVAEARRRLDATLAARSAVVRERIQAA